jgi:hypothetical protein
MVEENGNTELLRATHFVPSPSGMGWEAAVFDHFQAVVRAILARLSNEPDDEGTAGGSTYSFNVWPGHPFQREVTSALADFRARYSTLRSQVAAFIAPTGCRPITCRSRVTPVSSFPRSITVVMMKSNHRLAVRCLMLLVLALFVEACVSDRAPETTDTETHFLLRCAEECGQGTSCVCGRCTATCSEDTACAAFGISAKCASEAPECADDAPASCDVSCTVGADCQALGSDYGCEQGRCRLSPSTPAVPGPPLEVDVAVGGAPPASKVIVLWVVSARGSDYIYKFGEAPITGGALALRVPALPPAALNYTFAVGFPVVVDGSLEVPDGLVNEAVLQSAAGLPLTIIYRSKDDQRFASGMRASLSAFLAVPASTRFRRAYSTASNPSRAQRLSTSSSSKRRSAATGRDEATDGFVSGGCARKVIQHPVREPLAAAPEIRLAGAPA